MCFDFQNVTSGKHFVVAVILPEDGRLRVETCRSNTMRINRCE